MKITLEGINSRINETEELVSVLEDIGGNQCHVKKKKKSETVWETSTTMLSTPTFAL